MSLAIVTTPDDRDLASALRDAGIEVRLVERPISTSALEQAGIEEATLFVLTESEEATSIPIARELNPDVRVVVYASTGVPEFANHQADLVLAPDTFDQSMVVDALLDTI